MGSFGYVGKWPLTDKMEIHLDAFLSTPSPGYCIFLGSFLGFYFNNIFGPGVSLSIGFKRKIVENEKNTISYKFNFGIDYTADFQGALSFKNSILIGIRRKDSILSLNPFVNIGIKAGVLTFSNGLWFVLEPGFELVSKIVSKSDFVFISTFMIGYEMDFIGIGQKSNSVAIFIYDGKIVISSSFGIGKIVRK